jgi:ABC-2 type transport system ATP-binding protein
MRHLTRNQVHVEATGDLSVLTGMEGVYDLVLTPGQAEFHLYNGQTAPVMAAIAAAGATRIVSTPPTLEELFMSHYTS